MVPAARGRPARRGFQPVDANPASGEIVSRPYDIRSASDLDASARAGRGIGGPGPVLNTS